jgi:LmbE family N-acetylglucosaminyl deacetylase
MQAVKQLGKDVRFWVRRYSLSARMPFREITNAPTLIVAPHPDDETLGCGGLIALKRERNVNVRIVFLTSGERSLISCANIGPEEVGRIRRQQAIEVTEYLGLRAGDLIWFGFPDEKIPRRNEPGFSEAVNILRAEMERTPTEEIYCPHPHEGHHDHEAAADMTLEAIRQCRLPVHLFYYVIWTWFNGPWGIKKKLNVSKAWRLNIRHVIDKKSRAIDRYLYCGKAASGIPYCGKLPRFLIYCARMKDEIFLDSNFQHF